MSREQLERELLAWMREPDWRDAEPRFDDLARRLFAFQFAHCAPYRRYCEGRDRTPRSVRSWREIPPVPAGAFKEVALRCFPEEHTCKTFRTSGTSTAARGALHLDTLALYEASVVPSFRRHVLPDCERALLCVLAPPPEELPDSSLSHMFGVLVRELGAPGSGFHVREGRLEVEPLLERLRGAAHAPPLALCGTAFAFVHLLDELARRGERIALPPSARAMETGGFKGRARERSRAALHAELEERLGLPAGRVVNQYGMTELGSQFHDSVLRFPDEPRRKLGPPWARAVLLDPVSGAAVPDEEGAVGMISVVDLANTGSVCAVLTADLGRRTGDGFDVLGREPGAEARGCSIAADELLAGP